jgi:hypothetical protein
MFRGKRKLGSVVMLSDVYVQQVECKNCKLLRRQSWQKFWPDGNPQTGLCVVDLDFLFEALELRGFGVRWLNWIKNIVIGGSISVIANGEESNTFKTVKMHLGP